MNKHLYLCHLLVLSSSTTVNSTSIHTVRSVRVPTPHNCSQHIQANTTRGFIQSVFLMMGIMVPETRWVNVLWINIYTCVICWFFLLLHMTLFITALKSYSMVTYIAAVIPWLSVSVVKRLGVGALVVGAGSVAGWVLLAACLAERWTARSTRHHGPGSWALFLPSWCVEAGYSSLDVNSLCSGTWMVTAWKTGLFYATRMVYLFTQDKCRLQLGP